MKFTIIITSLILFCGQLHAQTNTNRYLFQSDSAVVYIAIINRFQVNLNEDIQTIGKPKGVHITIKKGLVEIRSFYKGIFPVQFKTRSGTKTVFLISQAVPPDYKEVKTGMN